MTSLQATWPPGLDGVLAFAEGSRPAGGSCLAPDVDSWLADPQQGLRSAAEAVHGADATADALSRLAPSRLTVVAVVSGEHGCWAELARSGGGDLETCLLGLTSDAADRVSRLVWLRAPLVPASGLGQDGAAPDGRPILDRYFADLMDSRFIEAAGCFTADTIYSHPPYGAGTSRVLFRGRAALRRGFAIQRGTTPASQVITALWQRHRRVFVEGVIEGIPDGGTFFSTAEITSTGEIARYVAFYCAQRFAVPHVGLGPASRSDGGPPVSLAPLIELR
jgi:hypothetical protein